MSKVGIDFDDTLVDHSSKSLLMEGAEEVLEDLQYRGYSLCIITARCNNKDSSEEVDAVVMYLRDQGIDISSITYTCGKPKGTYAHALQCQYMIDDNIKFLSDCLNNKVIPIHFKGGREQILPGSIIVDSWYDIPRILP